MRRKRQQWNCCRSLRLAVRDISLELILMEKLRQIVHNSCFLLSTILALFLSCGDALNITGITETDEASILIGNIDENDWCPPQQSSGTGGTISVEDGLRPAYPNPTNSSTQLPYQINKQTRVKLQIINKDKVIVRLLVDAIQPAGSYLVHWVLRDDKGDRVKNGFYRVQFFINDEFKCSGDIQVISNN